MSLFAKEDEIRIREVWNENLDEEFALINEIIDDFPYVAMDTEFPGIVVRPLGPFKNTNDCHYESLRENVNILKLIQMGFTFYDKDGNLPKCGTDRYCVWQFNFREFDVNDDMYMSDSIEMLMRCGIDLVKNRENGVDGKRFVELLMVSGVVCNPDVSWVTYHSGHDFGYLVRLLTCRNLPKSQSEFFDMIKIYFPVVYDIKHLMRFCNNLYGGLNKVAELLGVKRVGTAHQAGSDSLVTACTFWKLTEKHFTGSMEKYSGVLFGLGVESEQSV